MPNVKLFIDETLYAARRAEIAAMLPPLRESLCAEMSVPPAACQIAVLAVMGLPGQPSANLEMQYLAKPDRTPAMIAAACAVFRDVVEAALGSRPAVRATPLDPETYVALKL
ncbi:MAG: hypothetical protein KDK26_14540 [Roseivivax sp.]|nr:hypothetical protein [Roseivivax sp.]